MKRLTPKRAEFLLALRKAGNGTSMWIEFERVPDIRVLEGLERAGLVEWEFAKISGIRARLTDAGREVTP